MASPKQPVNFTARDTELLTHAFQCLKEKPNARQYQSEDPEDYISPHLHPISTPSSQQNPPPPPPLTNTFLSVFQIDYDLMAANAGFKGAKSARDSFGRLYDKILVGSEKNTSAEGEQSGKTGEPTPKTKKKGTPSKRKAGGADDDEHQGNDSSPSKKKKKTPGKAAGKKKLAAADEEDGDTIVVAVKSEGIEPDGEDGGVAGEDV